MTYILWSSDFALYLFDVWTSLFGIMNQYDPTFDLKIIVGHCDLYFMKTIWCMNIILQDYWSVWSDIWPQSKCKSLWPIFHGPVILCYILETIWCMNIIIWDYESVWPNVWPQNNCRSLWPIFHEDYLMYEHHTSGLLVSMIRHLTSK